MHADSIIVMFSRLTVRTIWTITVSGLTRQVLKLYNYIVLSTMPELR